MARRLSPLPAGVYDIDVEIKGGWYDMSVCGSMQLAVLDRADEDDEPVTAEEDS